MGSPQDLTPNPLPIAINEPKDSGLFCAHWRVQYFPRPEGFGSPLVHPCGALLCPCPALANLFEGDHRRISPQIRSPLPPRPTSHHRREFRRGVKWDPSRLWAAPCISHPYPNIPATLLTHPSPPLHPKDGAKTERREDGTRRRRRDKTGQDGKTERRKDGRRKTERRKDGRRKTEDKSQETPAKKTNHTTRLATSKKVIYHRPKDAVYTGHPFRLPAGPVHPRTRVGVCTRVPWVGGSGP